MKAALDKAVEIFGGLDFAFNNAGIEPRKLAPTADYDLTPNDGSLQRDSDWAGEGDLKEPIGTMGRPEEIANAVVWLCSDAASFFVGRTVVIDGGQTIQ